MLIGHKFKVSFAAEKEVDESTLYMEEARVEAFGVDWVVFRRCDGGLPYAICFYDGETPEQILEFITFLAEPVFVQKPSPEPKLTEPYYIRKLSSGDLLRRENEEPNSSISFINLAWKTAEFDDLGEARRFLAKCIGAEITDIPF
jgi:hypothetical protein